MCRYLKTSDLDLHVEVPAVEAMHAEWRYSKPRYTARLNAKL